MSDLVLSDLGVTRHGRPVLDGITLRLRAGECVGLIGPNGAGKTTLLRAALGLLPHRGRASLAELDGADRARTAAWLPQAREIAWPLPVRDVVALGRLPHRATRAEDAAATERALARMALEGLADRPATELSGGEQARVLIARALAQETPMLLADEPIAGLDPAAQWTTLETFAALAAEGHLVVTALHDLGLAARFCTRLIVLDQGRIAADGPPATVLDRATLARVFRLDATLERGTLNIHGVTS